MANKKLEQSNMKPLMILEEKKVLITMQSTKKEVNKGAWTREEDQKLAEVIAVHGAKKWKTIATIAGLNRCGKSCRLRWLNYLRPNIKRGNISDQEEDLILRLHKLLGNRWSLIAGRLPGRTDNEIKNYWNSHLSKRISQNKDQIKQSGTSSKKNNIIIRSSQGSRRRINKFHDHLQVTKEENIDFNNNNNNNNNNNININIVSRGSNSSADHDQDSNCSSTSDFDVNDFFDFSTEGPTNLEWMSRFLDRGGSF